MAETKISALTAAVSVADADELPVIQSSTTKRATAAMIRAASQPLDSDLTAIAALTTTSFGRSLLALADAAALRAAAVLVRTVTANFDGAGSVLSTGKAKGYYRMPHTGTITGWSISADAGTATIDVWKIAAGTAVPTVANKITTSGVSLSSGTAVRSTTVTDFGANTTVSLGDIIAINLTTVATATQLTFSLEITLT